MIKKILILVISLICLSGCTIVGFDKGLNYEKIPEYKFEYNRGSSGYVAITNKKNGNHINIAFRRNSCGEYGLFGPLIFPIIPMWQNHNCLENATIGVYQASHVYIIYNDKVYRPIEVSRTGGYTFPLPIKSITNVATLIVEQENGQKFEIPFRYKHTFDVNLWPGR
jgi:hypothetical protein